MAVEKTPRARAEQEPEPEKVPVPEPLVFLYIEPPHTCFDLSGLGLPDLLPEGTAYSRKDADRVLTLCMKYRIRVHEGQ